VFLTAFLHVLVYLVLRYTTGMTLKEVKDKVIIRTRTYELVRWRRHIFQGSEIMYDTRFLENVEHFMRIFFCKMLKKKYMLVVRTYNLHIGLMQVSHEPVMS